MSKIGPHSKASAARQAALQVNKIVRERNAFTQEIIASVIDASPTLSPEDRAFATRLCLGVTSSLGTLDELIDSFVRDFRSLDSEVRDVLRIGTYEIIYLDKSPHAAVDQGVELTKSVNPKTSGLVNAVLRKVVGAKEKFPFGNPATDPSALARLHGFPLWLTERLLEDLGYEATEKFMQASNEPAPVFIAANLIKASPEEVAEVFALAKATLKDITMGTSTFPGCWRLENTKSLHHPEVTNLFSTGKILVSDLASQVIARLITNNPEPKAFLEIGSGRGTKTILLQSDAIAAYGHQMNMSVCDNHQFKVELHTKRMKQYGVAVQSSYVADATTLSQLVATKEPGRTFDAVFLDAPCSGLGTLRRHPEIRWRLTPKGISELATLQLALLSDAARLTSVGGVLTYATCTVLKEENTEVVKKFLTSDQGKAFEIQKLGGRDFFASAVTPGSSDAHFAVSMVRKR